MANQESIHAAGSGDDASRVWIMLILAGFLTLGVVFSVWRYHQVDNRMRDALVEEATLISWGLRADLVDQLRGDPGDIGTPNYDRIKAQLSETRKLFPYYRFLYLMRLEPDKPIIFLVDSEPAESPDYSPPGQAYDEASSLLRSTFFSNRPVTEGPMKDRWGVWYSAFIPLYHPYNNKLVAVLGVDIDASQWRRDVLKSTAPPILATILLMSLAIVFFTWRHGAANSRTLVVRRRWEVVVSAVFGVVLSMALALAVDENENWMIHQSFQRIATVQANTLQQMLFRIGDNYLEGIARFFDSSDFVDRKDFAQYTGFLLNRPYAMAWSWATAVQEKDKDEFEELLSSSGTEGFSIWQRGPGDERVSVASRPVYYPVSYLEPQRHGRKLLGFDIGSEPHFKEAIGEAVRSDMITASMAMADPGFSNIMTTVVFRPVFRKDGDRQLSGLAIAVLNMDSILMRALSRDVSGRRPVSYVEMYEMIPGREPLFVTASDRRPEGRLLKERQTLVGLRGLTSFSCPAYAFGRTYALMSEPTAGFTALHPRREGWRALMVGLVVTTLVSALMALLSNRRAMLESEVLSRTADLKKSEESYRGLFNAIQQSIYIQDENGAFIDVNDGAINRYGYAREEFIGRTPEFLAAPGRNDMDHVQQCFKRTWEGHPQHFEFWGKRKDGQVFPKEVWLCKGTHLGKDVVIAMSTDITERKRSEEENRRLQAQLLQSQKMESIGRLAGGVAHDFNNMLQAIIGNTSLAKQEVRAGHPVAEYLNEIEQSAHRSARLTRQLLAFASRQTIQPRILDLNDTVAGMLKMLQRLIGENIQLSWKPGPNLWPVKIDPGQIDQILANLAVNARDAITGNGIIEIETANYSCDAGHCLRSCQSCRPCRYVMITVRDNGCGMSEEVRSHLFEPFYTTKAPGKGTGLGLATVFGIVQQNDGVIEVQSEPGQGSVFHIMLPMIDTDLPVPTSSAADTDFSGRETILLVEDEAVILQVGMISLQRLGYQVLVAALPNEALRIVRDHPGRIDLLITDVILPEMNGPELARQIAILKPDIRCLFMSGYTADVISEGGVLDESVNFIQKPFTISDLAAKIRSVFDAPA